MAKDERKFPKAEIRAALRKAWTMSESYHAFADSKKIKTFPLKKDGTPSKKPDVHYKCSSCGELNKLRLPVGKTLTKKNTYKVKYKNLTYFDHIIPVVDPKEGFKDWYTYWERLYVSPEEWETRLQVLCHICHKDKTDEEKALRAEHGTLRTARSVT